jgi:DNA-binding HxlR family transcriptional regulator
MPRTSLAEIDCGVAQALHVLGDRWTLLVLRNAFHGMKTFEAFRDHLELSTSVLSERLAALTDAGIFERIPSPRDRRSVEYKLTDKGLDLYPVVVAMMQWGDRWAPDPGGKRVVLLERATGLPVRGCEVVSADGRGLGPREVRPALGPGADEKLRQLVERDWKGSSGGPGSEENGGKRPPLGHR